MHPIVALLELHAIDQRRQSLKQERDRRTAKVVEAGKRLAAAQAAAQAAQAEVDRLGALARQYQADMQRCDATITDLRAKQMGAKTNKDYMAIINGIEQAKSERNQREQSVKDLAGRTAVLQQKADAAQATATTVQAEHDQVAAAAGDTTVSPAEQALQAEYDAAKAKVDPAFLDVYERLVKARHRMPLVRVDPRTRSTPTGAIASHNQVEQIRMGKLVIDRNTNGILYLEPSALGAAVANSAPAAE
jgi:predicted  nucleic acid-binding Zn-ribbon protein